MWEFDLEELGLEARFGGTRLGGAWPRGAQF